MAYLYYVPQIVVFSKRHHFHYPHFVSYDFYVIAIKIAGSSSIAHYSKLRVDPLLFMFNIRV